jgi:hypothetical protein
VAVRVRKRHPRKLGLRPIPQQSVSSALREPRLSIKDAVKPAQRLIIIINLWKIYELLSKVFMILGIKYKSFYNQKKLHLIINILEMLRAINQSNSKETILKIYKIVSELSEEIEDSRKYYRKVKEIEQLIEILSELRKLLEDIQILFSESTSSKRQSSFLELIKSTTRLVKYLRNLLKEANSKEEYACNVLIEEQSPMLTLCENTDGKVTIKKYKETITNYENSKLIEIKNEIPETLKYQDKSISYARIDLRKSFIVIVKVDAKCSKPSGIGSKHEIVINNVSISKELLKRIFADLNGYLNWEEKISLEPGCYELIYRNSAPSSSPWQACISVTLMNRQLIKKGKVFEGNPLKVEFPI